MLRSLHWYLLGLLTVALAGCTNPEFGMPRWCDIGPESYQVKRARKFDPFPDPNIGPAVLGGRPPDYMDPRPEPDISKRGQFYPWPYSSSSYPPPSTPPVVTYPPATYPPTAVVPSYSAPGSATEPIAYGTRITSP